MCSSHRWEAQLVTVRPGWIKIKIKIKSNQVFKLDNVRSGCPFSRVRGSCIKWLSIPVELEFRSAGFWGEGKTRVPGGKPLGAEKEPTTNLAHIWSELRIKPGPHWWEASALTTVPALLPQNVWICGQHAQLGVFRDGLWSSYLTYIHQTSLASRSIPVKLLTSGNMIYTLLRSAYNRVC